MTRVTVHEYAAALRPRYRAARKGSKGKILDEFCRTTGMHRKAAIRPLRSGGKLKPVRSRGRPRLHGPGVAARPATTALKSQVPIRTWSEWKGVPPGSLQADLVLHCGDSTEGFFLTTLTAVDVARGWTELQPVWGVGKERGGTGR